MLVGLVWGCIDCFVGCFVLLLVPVCFGLVYV